MGLIPQRVLAVSWDKSKPNVAAPTLFLAKSVVENLAIQEHLDYQVGGSLRFDADCYIKRQADDDLLKTLLSGEYCYVFNARQMGKSSLRVRTQQQLVTAGKLCASVDMTSIGSERVTPMQWYKGLMVDLLTKFDLWGMVNFKQWWQAQAELSMVQRLRLFIEEILLRHLPDADIFIFVDEIDSALALDFPIDDFFALVRFCYNERAENADYRRLTWSLFGVVTPSDLIRDRLRTPFNVGHAIELKGLMFDDARGLARGLVGYEYDALALLQEILVWTNGQPFLTQKLCRLTAQTLETRRLLDTGDAPTRDLQCEAMATPLRRQIALLPTSAEKLIEQVVYTQVIDHWESQDDPEHLRTIRDRLLRNELLAPRLLGIYETILTASTPCCDLPVATNQSEAISQTEEERRLAYDDSPEHLDLLLSGLIGIYQGRLAVKNRIYQTIFDMAWVKNQLNTLRPYAKQLSAWVMSDRTDESRLLRGKALKDAQAWSQERSVGEVDHDFLMASERYDRSVVQQAFKSARLREVEKRLVVERRSRRKQRGFIAALSGALAIATTLGVIARRQYLNSVKTQLRSLVTTAEALYASDQRLDALVSAIDANAFMAQSQQVPAELRDRADAILRTTAVSAVEKNQIMLPEGTFWDVAISPDGNYWVTSGSDGIVRLWQKDGTLLQTFVGHKARVRTVAFMNNGTRIISGSDDRTVKVWSIDGTLLKTLQGHVDAVHAIDISSDGQLIASAGTDGVIKIWSDNYDLVSTFYSYTPELLALAFSPDGKTIASGGIDGNVKLWDLDGNLLRSLAGHSDATSALAFSPDGSELVSGGRDSRIIYWDTATSQQIRTIEAHRTQVLDLAFSEDGQQLVSSSRDRTIKLWNANGQPIATLEGHQGRIWDVQFAPGGKQLVSASEDRTIRLWDLTNPLLTSYLGPSDGIIGIDFSPTKNLIAAASDDRYLRLWNETSGQLSGRFQHPDSVLSVAFSKDGEYLVTGSWDGVARLWNLAGEQLAELLGHDKPIWDAVFSPDGQTIATGSVDREIRLWDLEGNVKSSFIGHQGEIRSVAFSSNGLFLLSASLDSTVNLWRLSEDANGTPTLVKVFRGPTQSGFIDANFSPDGQLIVAGGFDNLARVWSVDGELVATLEGHAAEVRSVSFSADGKTIVTASGDGQVKLWQLDGTLIATLAENGEPVWQALFVDGDQKVISAGEDRKVLRWQLNTMLDRQGLFNASCSWSADYLAHSPNTEDQRLLCDDTPSAEVSESAAK
ncbi:MAG: AAA-like domain-containing protein [Phormidesmis sp.]